MIPHLKKDTVFYEKPGYFFNNMFLLSHGNGKISKPRNELLNCLYLNIKKYRQIFWRHFHFHSPTMSLIAVF